MRIVDLREQYFQLLQAGDRRASNLALVTAGYMRQTFASADASLRQLALHSQRIGGPTAPESDWGPALVSAHAALPAVGSLTITDRKGIIKHSSQPIIIGEDRSSDYLFRRLSTEATDSLIASPPFRSRTPSRQYLIPIARRLVTKTGEFDGIIVATVVPEQFRDLFRSVDFGREGSISVIHRNGIVVIRAPADSDPIGQAAERPVLIDAARHSPSGVMRELSHSRGGPIMRTAFRTIADRDLIVAVSLAEDELLAEWRTAVVGSIAIGALLFVACMAILILLDRAVETRVSAQEALGRSQRMESIGRLTGGIAHDFNNILSVILGNVELIRDDLSDASSYETRESAKQIERAATRGSALVRQLLAFSRKQPLQPRSTDIAQLVRDTRPMLDRVLGEDVSLDVRFDDSAALANVDPVGVESSLLNLCINARDAMPSGGSIGVRVSHQTVGTNGVNERGDVAPGSYVVVSVSDTGSGISAQDVQRVFDPFFTTKDVGRGTGLGLSIVYGFMKQSGGLATLRSAVGVGTTVSLYFPQTTIAPEIEPSSADVADSALAGNGETILVVEDEPDLLALRVRLLERYGYRALPASNGHEALDIARREPHIDLLLSDIVMPGLNGRRLAAELRARQPGLPVIFVSGYASDELDTERDGNDPVIAKPYDRAVLALAIKTELSRRAAAPRRVTTLE